MSTTVHSQRLIATKSSVASVSPQQVRPVSPDYESELDAYSSKPSNIKYQQCYATAPLSPPLSTTGLANEDRIAPQSPVINDLNFGKLNASDEERMESVCGMFFSAMYEEAVNEKILASARKYNVSALSRSQKISYQSEFTFQMKNAVKAANDRHVAKKLQFNDTQMYALEKLKSALHKLESPSARIPLESWASKVKPTSESSPQEALPQLTSYSTEAAYYQPRSTDRDITWGQVESFQTEQFLPVKKSHRRVFRALHLFLMSLLKFNNDAAVTLYNSSVQAKLKEGFASPLDASKSVASGTFYYWNLAIILYATELGPMSFLSQSRISLLKHFLGQFARPLGLAVHLLPSMDNNVKKRKSSIASIRGRSTSSLSPGFESVKRKRVGSSSGTERHQSAVAQQMRAIVQRCLDAMHQIGDGKVHQTAERFFGVFNTFKDQSAADAIKACYESSFQLVDLEDCLVTEMILGEKIGTARPSGISHVFTKKKLSSVDDVRMLESEVDKICVLSKWLAILVRISLPYSVPTVDTTKFSLTAPKIKSSPQISFTEGGKVQFKSSQSRGEGTVPWLVSELLMRYLMVVQPYLQKILKLLKTGGSGAPTKFELFDAKNVGKNLFTTLRTKRSASSNFQAEIEQVYSEATTSFAASSLTERLLRSALMEKLKGVARCGIQSVEKEFQELVNEDVELAKAHSIIPYY